MEQHAGRLHRDYKGKHDVIIYYFVDVHIRLLESMYYKWLRIYSGSGTKSSRIPMMKNRLAAQFWARRAIYPFTRKTCNKHARASILQALD